MTDDTPVEHPHVPSSGATGQAGREPGSTGQGGQKGKQRYMARVVGGEVAEDLFERGLCLPSGRAMADSDLDRVIDTILNSRKKAQESAKTRKGQQMRDDGGHPSEMRFAVTASISRGREDIPVE